MLISWIMILVGCVLGIYGWFASHSLTMLLIGVALNVISEIASAIRTDSKIVDTFVRFALFFIIGAVICIFIKSIPWYAGGLLTILIWGLIQIIAVAVMALADR